MFKQPKVPTPDPLPLGVDSSRMATNEPAIPLPWAVGKNRIALKWISPAFNQRTTEIKQKVGKKTQTTGYNVYCDIAGAICAGPVDKLYAIYVDGTLVWESSAAVRNSTNPHYYQTTVPSFGKFRIYWGTSTQPKDTLILNYAAPRDNTIDPDEEFWEYPNGNITKIPSTYTVSACPDDHPAYLDQCYMVWSQLFCGQNRESVPNIEVVVGKAARFSTLDTEVTDEGVNPISAIAELLTNDLYGAGLPASVIDPTQWETVASVASNRRTFARYTNPTPVSVPFGHLSPCIDRQMTVKQLLNDLFLYFDGYVRPRNGMLEAGCFPHDGVIPTGLTTLTLQDDTQLPEYQAGSWADALSQVTVIHRDGDRAFNDNAETSSLPLAVAISGQKQRDSLQRPHFVTRWQAQEYATRWMQIHAHPQNLARGRIRVRKEKAVNQDGSPILAGDRFIFDYAPYSLQLVARAISRTDQGYGGEVEINFEAERGIAPIPYVPQGDSRPNTQQVAPTAIANARIFQLPAQYLNDPAPAVVPLVERPAAATTGFNAFFSTSDTTYDLAGTAVNWAVRGTLASVVANTDTTLTLNADGLDLVKLQSQSSAAQYDDTLLLFVDSEILSIGTVTALGGGQYSASVLRGRQGSAAASHSSSAVCYVIPRADLLVLQNANFPRTSTTNYFKLQSFTQNDEQSLADALKITFTFADRGVNAPTNLTATAQTNGIFLKWDNPSDPDLAFIEIFERNAIPMAIPSPPSSLTPDYTIYGNSFLRGGLSGGTTKYYYIRAVDTISDKSVLVGPVDATATDAITATLTNDAALVPADASGNVTSFSGAVSSMKVFKSATDDTANWSFTKTDTSCTSSLSASTVTVSALSADVGYVDITATRSGFSSITKRFTISKAKTGATGATGSAGTRGSKQFYASGTSWSDSTADAAITSAGLTKVLLDQVTISGGSFSQTKYWDGSVWQTITQVIDGNLLVNGSIGATKIAVSSLSALTANLGTVTAGSITASASISVGSSTAAVSISSSGLTIAGGRITAAGDGSNPYIRAYGTGSFSSYYVELNGYSGGVAPFFQAVGGGTTTTINSTQVTTPNLSVSGTSNEAYIRVSGNIGKQSADAWTPPLVTNANNISFSWQSNQLRVKIDNTDVGYVTLN